MEVVTTFTMQGCEALTEKFEVSFKGATEMAKELHAAPMGAEVEAEALSALHGTTSVLERQVEAMEDKFVLLDGAVRNRERKVISMLVKIV
jgi:hypothetical protein